jgi:hypothetical protein
VHIYPSIEAQIQCSSLIGKTKKRDGDFDLKLKNKLGKYGFGTVYKG